jgi:hypothetical protein
MRGVLHCTSGRWVAITLTALLGAPATRAEPEPKREGVTCRHWAVLLPEDAGQHRVYDGIRKGLELAQLERVCLKDVTDEEASFKDLVAWHATLAKPEPLLFAIGRRAGARLVAAGYEGPGVLMSTEVTAQGELIAPEPALGPRMARVRAEVAAEVWGAALREMLGLESDATPKVDVAWAEERPGQARESLSRFAWAAGVKVPGQASGWLLGSMDDNPHSGDVDPSPPRALLHVRLGVGERLLPFEKAREEALRLKIPLLSDDPARFGSGAVLVIVPDHQRVGRTAAEAGRRLWRNEPDALAKPLVVRSTEVWVDLVAAQAIGLEPPLTFLAAADRVRAPPKPAPTKLPSGLRPGGPATSPPAPTPSTPR